MARWHQAAIPVSALATLWLTSFAFSSAMGLPTWSFIVVASGATLVGAFLWVIAKVGHGGAWSRSRRTWSGRY